MLRSLATQVILAMTLAFFSVACASDSSPPSSSGSSSSSSSSSSTSEAAESEDEEQAVIDAYLAAIDAFYLAANPPDPEHPALAATHGGELLESVRTSLRELAEEGHAIRRGPATRYSPVVIRLSATTAVVTDCGTDGDIEFELATGQVIDDSVLVGQSIAELVLLDGEWITVAVEFREGPCEGAS